MGKVKLSGTAEPAFLVNGFTNWKDATRNFTKHGTCDFHRSAAAALTNRVDIGEMLSKQYATEKRANREYLLKILSSVRFLARQGLPLRGDMDETNSNFYQLLMLRGEDSDGPGLKAFLDKKQLKYTSHEIQNEMPATMALQVLRDVAKNLQSSSYFCIMIDKTTDASNVEQVVLVFRWVDDDLAVHEEFIGLYQSDSIDAKSLVAIIRDTLLRMNLKIENCRGQCYDGASSMSGTKGGVAKLISDDEPRAVYTHCYGHALNLSVGDTVKQCRVMRSVLGTVYEISKLIKKSPKRDASFQKLKQELAPDTPGFRVICPTRWTVRAASLQSVLDNFEVLLGFWTESQEGHLDSEIEARVIGVEAQMHTFDFLFGVALGSLILRHSDNLSKSLQHEHMSAAEGQELVKLTHEVLKSLRQPEQFQLFYQRVIRHQEKLNISPPTLFRKRRAPRHLEAGSAESDGHFHTSPEDHYRQIYYEALDLVISSITARFDQPGYQVYRNVKDLILKACSGCPYDPELEYVCTFYKDDVNMLKLQAQLPLLKPLITEGKTELTIGAITHQLAGLSKAQQVAFSEVWVLFKLLLVMPATNATSERSFSALRRVKTYLRSTMTQMRLKNLMVLHVHKDKTDALDLTSIGKEFVALKDTRVRLFGQF